MHMEIEADYISRVPSAVKGKEGHDIGVVYEGKRGPMTVHLSLYPLNNKVFLIPTKEENKQHTTILP